LGVFAESEISITLIEIPNSRLKELSFNLITLFSDEHDTSESKVNQANMSKYIHQRYWLLFYVF